MPHTINNKALPTIGIGLISLNNPANAIPVPTAISLLKAALTAGCNFWDGAEYYGPANNNSLHLFKAYFEQYPEDVDKVIVSIKGCFAAGKVYASARDVKRSLDHCLKVIDGKYKIDVFSPGRLDPEIPVEETITAIAEYVHAGKIGSVGLSECSAASLRKAASIVPISAVEIELSLFETSVLHNGLADACKELGIPILAYSPLARGFLTGSIKKYEDLAADDFRRHFPRFAKENFDANFALVREVEKVAERKSCTPGQVAIAWVVKQGEWLGMPVVPVPGTKDHGRLAENMTVVELCEKDLEEVEAALEKCEVKGARYPAMFEKYLHV